MDLVILPFDWDLGCREYIDDTLGNLWSNTVAREKDYFSLCNFRKEEFRLVFQKSFCGIRSDKHWESDLKVEKIYAWSSLKMAKEKHFSPQILKEIIALKPW